MTATKTKKAPKGGMAKSAKAPTEGEATATAPKPEKPAKSKNAAKPKADGKMSGLDAAAKVLAEAGTPLKCNEIVERAVAKGYWQTNGQTPSATLYSAMLREINVKEKESRFQRTDKGTFALNG